MEEQKLQYLRQMLDENHDISLEDYLKVLRKLEPAARRCYYENIEMDSDEFVKMLLYDACFIILLTINWSYPFNDIVPTISWNVPLIRTDLLMLENQIPFFVLQYVFDLYLSREDDTPKLVPPPSPSNGDSGGIEFANASLSEDSGPEKPTLVDVLVSFLNWGGHVELTVPEQCSDYAHLLNFDYHCYMSTQELPTKRRKKFLVFGSLGLKKASALISSIEKKLTTCRRLPTRLRFKRKPRSIPCATELQEKGITFKKAETNSIFGVQFSHGVLRIPYTSLKETTRAHIMNLIAFENCSGQKEKPLTSYAVFMICILKTPRDVLVLRRSGIIGNELDTEKVVVELFKEITSFSYLDFENHLLAWLFRDVTDCGNYRWKKYIADLWQNYFRSPWSIISFIAAIALLIFTFLQTLYTVMSYYRSP